ncbi:MAG: hypothetical protein V3T72_04295 [Thermoanaerobaculia bacterium]
MITFLTFYLGLVVGLRDFELAVAENTARVEILLDGEIRTEITVPPWKFQVDLGEVPLPHELTAVAYDIDGKPLGQAFQRLNVPHPPVEVAIALESEDGLVRTARLAWEAAADEALSGVRVRLDGRKIPVDDPQNIPLPPLDMSRHHHLSAEVTFRGRLRTQTAVVFGGSFVDQIDTELTAVVVEKLGDGEDDRVPPSGEIAGWFHRRGAALSVFAVERPPAEVMLVRDQTSARRLLRFAGSLGATGPGQQSLSGNLERLLERRVRILGIGLAEDDWLRVMATQPERRQETGKAFFRASGDVSEIARGLGMGVAGLRVPGNGRPERLADAVAASGLEIAGGGRRRIVLLVVDPRTTDASSLTPREAELYLHAMRVPLAVWTAGDAKAVSRVWGAGRNVGRPGRLADAVEELMSRLDRQLVIWLEGRLLPTEIELTAEGQRHVAFPHVPLVSGQGP